MPRLRTAPVNGAENRASGTVGSTLDRASSTSGSSGSVSGSVNTSGASGSDWASSSVNRQ